MKRYIYLLLLIFFTSEIKAHTSHYEGLMKINMEVFRNGKLIGYSNYFFSYQNDKLTVKNYTQFKVKLLETTIFSISSEAIEEYKDNKLVSFKSITFQNRKEKYVKLNYDKEKQKFFINGSSYKGFVETDAIVGNWWNHKILKAKKQISPISGSVKEQVVKYIGPENINLYGKNYRTDHFKLISKNKDLPKNKKLNFDIWIDKENNFILKVAYSRMGKWEYRLKNFE